jgi:hypothetical protein
MSRDDRVESIYVGGLVQSEYRHRARDAQLSVGWSAGLVNGWVQRWSAGVSLAQDEYLAVAGRPGPDALPPDETLGTPWLRYELVEDRFARRRNRSLMGRPEFAATGLQAHAQLGWSRPGRGTNRTQALSVDMSVSRGFEPLPGHEFQASLSHTGRYRGGAVERGLTAVRLGYAVPQSPRWLFDATLSLDALQRPQLPDLLYLGGDSGLRGYPLRYQVGTRRALLTLEDRYFTDIYLWRLFRVGAAVFADTGRAWGGAVTNVQDPGWLGDVGVGLRFVNTRAAFSNVLHVDLAFPLNPYTGIRRVQFLVKTKASF